MATKFTVPGPDFDKEIDDLVSVESDKEIDGQDEEVLNEPNSVWYIEHIKTAFYVLRLLPIIIALSIAFYFGMTINCAGEYEEAIKKNEQRLYGD